MLYGRNRGPWRLWAGLLVGLLVAACSDASARGPLDASDGGDDAVSRDAQDVPDGDSDLDSDLENDVVSDVHDGAADSVDAPSSTGFVAVTFNTGSGPELAHNRGPDDGYTSVEAALSDEWYGNGLAWSAFVETTRQWFSDVDPDVVVFQEIFWPGLCPEIPEAARSGFICEDWEPGDPTVAQVLLGEGWQVACHPGNSDKCAAVHRRFGTFAGCDGGFCLEGLTGFRIEGCGSGARVARGVIELTEGGRLTLVNVHGTSGGNSEDRGCRVAQVEQVFLDLGDGEPAANGERNLVMGDLNTDPGRLASSDESAARWNDFVAEGEAFRYLTEVGPHAPSTYLGLGSLDHAASDVLEGECWAAGVTEGHPAVLEAVFFDHTPIVCELDWPE